MRLAVSKDGKELGELKTVPTPQDFEEGMRMLQQMGEELRGGENIKGVGGSIAGSFDKDHTVLLFSPNMQGWVEKPLQKRLEDMFQAPVCLENDAALAGLGEATRGAGRGYGIVAYITVSTGVGGARIVDDAIDRNVSGFEPGHQIINYDSKTKTLEEHVSGSSFLKRFGRPPQEVTDSAIWEETARSLAYGLCNTILHWSPDVLVVGGPLILKSLFPFESFKKQLTEDVLRAFPIVPDIKKAEFGGQSGLMGALVLLHDKMKNS